MSIFHVKINEVKSEIEANSSSDAIIIALMQPTTGDPDGCLNTVNQGLCVCAEYAGEVTPTVQSTEENILAFGIPGQVTFPVISQGGHTVAVDVPNGTDVTALIANFVLSPGATVQAIAIDQVSGVTPNDFTSAVIYTVTAEDGTTTQAWTVTVTILAP